MPFELNPEVAAALGKLMGPNPPPPPPVGDVKGRRAMLDAFFTMLVGQGTTIDDVDVKEFKTKASDGHELILRWYTKKDHPLPGSAVLYSHGGGMIALTIDNYDQIVKRYVSRTGVPFLLVDYRLAPEVQAPTPVTDAYAGLQYLVTNASSLGVDTSRIAIMGDSAGGGISASLAHYIKLKGGPAVKKQILIYPMLDDRVLESDPNIAPFCTWTADDNKTGWGALLGDKHGSDNVDPIEAAGRATVKDARGLPPAYMDVGELDLFRDEDIEYVQTLGKAGVECEFHLVPGVPHAFEGFAPEAEVSRMTMENRFRVLKAL
jgi:acetyl esterase/lipase